MGCVTSKHGSGTTSVTSSPVSVLRKNGHGFPFSSKQNSVIDEIDRDAENLDENGCVQNLKKPKRETCAARNSVSFSFKLALNQRFVGAENVAAGWPSWLSSAAAEAVHGWLPLQADSFEKLDKIGQGTYSSVFKAREVETGRMVALKKVRFDNFQPESIRFMAREITILRRLNHPNIMKLEGLITSRFSSTIYLVFEYMEHDLAGLSSCPDIKFSEAQVKCYMQQLLMGLEHCHLRGVMHRDIKSSNILVNNEGVLKLGDFGLANILTSKNRQQLTSRVVTLWYRPPELLMGSTSYDVSVDLWSVGCVFAEVLTGKPILKGRTEVEQLHKIFKLCGSPPDDYWKNQKLPHSTMFKPQHPYQSCLRQRCLSPDIPATAFNLLETLLSIEPHKRGTASSSLMSEYFRTEPYACDPSTLPKYSPNKEFDAKHRDDLRRKKVGARTRDPEVTRRPRKSFQEVNNFNKTMVKEDTRDNVRFGGKNHGVVTANHPKPKERNVHLDTRSETSQVTAAESRGDIFAAGSDSFAWAKDTKSTVSCNQISDADSSSFVFLNASKQVKQDDSEGVLDQQAEKKFEKSDFVDAIDGIRHEETRTKQKNKFKVGCSGPLITESDQVDELLQMNENHIRQAARRPMLDEEMSKGLLAFSFKDFENGLPQGKERNSIKFEAS